MTHRGLSSVVFSQTAVPLAADGSDRVEQRRTDRQSLGLGSLLGLPFLVDDLLPCEDWLPVVETDGPVSSSCPRLRRRLEHPNATSPEQFDGTVAVRPRPDSTRCRESCGRPEPTQALPSVLSRHHREEDPREIELGETLSRELSTSRVVLVEE